MAGEFGKPLMGFPEVVKLAKETLDSELRIAFARIPIPDGIDPKSPIEVVSAQATSHLIGALSLIHI